MTKMIRIVNFPTSSIIYQVKVRISYFRILIRRGKPVDDDKNDKNRKKCLPTLIQGIYEQLLVVVAVPLSFVLILL